MAAAAVIAIIIPVLLMLVARRHIMTGLTFGVIRREVGHGKGDARHRNDRRLLPERRDHHDDADGSPHRDRSRRWIRRRRGPGGAPRSATPTSSARPPTSCATGEVLSLNGIQLQLSPDGGLDRDRLDAELPPRLAICRALAATYLLVVPPRAPGRGPGTVDRGRARRTRRDPGPRCADGRRGRPSSSSASETARSTRRLWRARSWRPSPASAVVLDSCHWHASGSGSLDPFPVDRLAITHLNDAPAKPPREIEDEDRLLPGRGVIRLTDLVPRPSPSRLQRALEPGDIQPGILVRGSAPDRDGGPAARS